jgi:nicotinamide mononucleotide transporter
MNIELSNIFLKIFDYELSYLEFFAVLTGLAAVYLASRGKVVNFYIGLINNVLYFMLFYQCRLYSMMFLQAAYFAISSYGIYSWSKPNENRERLKITRLTRRQWFLISGAILLAAAVWGSLVLWLSGKYPENIEKPQYPYIDALLTMASVCGQILLTRKKIDNWTIWIVVNTASIALYAVVGIYFTSILYAVFLLIAIKAYIDWKKLI